MIEKKIRVLIERQPDNGIETIGDFFIYENDSQIFTCKSLELPFKGNKRGESCIPADTYECEKLLKSESIPYPHIAIKNVPNRDGIKIHKITYVKNLRGCIGVGMSLADFNKDGVDDIAYSTVALEKILSLLPDEFELTISYKNQNT